MAQLMIDTDTESVAGLMLLSRLLTDYANMRAVQDKALADSVTDFKSPSPQGDSNQQADLYAHAARALGFGTPDTVAEPDPAMLSTKSPFTVPAIPTVPTGTNVVPLFPQPALNLSGATGPAVLGAPIASPVTLAAAPTIPTNVPSSPAAPAVVLSADVDSQGIPWDERIHSSSKKKKGDGTWILKRGVDHTLAQTITAELMAAKIATPTTNVPVPNLPVTLPPGPVLSGNNGAAPASAVPVFPGTTVLPAQHTGGAVPIPGGPGSGAVPSGPVNPVTRFREMMGKISAALGSKVITQAQVTAAHQSQQLEQLQQAVLFPDKIPLIEQALGFAS